MSYNGVLWKGRSQSRALQPTDDLVLRASTPGAAAGGSFAEVVLFHADAKLADYEVASITFTPLTTDTDVDADEFWTTTVRKRDSADYSTADANGATAHSAGFTAFTPQNLTVTNGAIASGDVWTVTAAEGTATTDVTPVYPAGVFTVRLRKA